jgi:hypothetical protein
VQIEICKADAPANSCSGTYKIPEEYGGPVAIMGVISWETREGRGDKSAAATVIVAADP